MSPFYQAVIEELLEAKILDRQMKLLVICGGKQDREILMQAGFQDVVISNLDSRMSGNEFLPYEWSFQNAESLTFNDESFDFCLVHAGLHHCYSPHRALLEMYRVAKKGLLLIEPYDNLSTQVGVRLNIGQSYEHAAVFYNDCAYGGVQNTAIPNYIYRWTQGEIIKSIKTYAPYGKHTFHFIHKFVIPWTQLKRRKNKAFYYAVSLLFPAIKLVEKLFPQQSNHFAAVILKPTLPNDLHPWLMLDGETIKPNKKWLENVYKR